MNRGHSADSLDNSDADIKRSSSNSSSPTDLVFTSDDEAGCSNQYDQGLDNFSKYATSKLPTSIDTPIGHPVLMPITKWGLRSQNNYQRRRCLDDSSIDSAIKFLANREMNYDEQDTSCVSTNKQIPLGVEDVDSRSLALRMCSNLLECRNLLDAIMFVRENQASINDITRVIREAPAFRDYDMSLYHTDYSVKETFNPNFWLDREPVVTTADGNCQYHAVSISLTGTEVFTPHLRLATAVAVIDNCQWFDSMLRLIDKGTVFDLVRTIARNYSWGDETTLKATSVAIGRRIFLYTCNVGKKDYEVLKTLSRDDLIDAFKEKQYRGGTGIHAYADPLVPVNPDNYIMLFHKSEHFIAVLPTEQQLTMFEPYNPILPAFT